MKILARPAAGRFFLQIASAVLSVAGLTPGGVLVAYAQEEAGHMHGPDGRHIAAASTFGPTARQGPSILSHHDLMIQDTRKAGGPEGKGAVVVGADVHSIVQRRGNPQAVIHREHNSYEPENFVYGSHMMYREPGEYEIVENVTLPGGEKMTLTFPVWVPAPPGTASGAAAAAHEHDDGPSALAWVAGGIGVLALLAGAFVLGRRSGRHSAAALVLAVSVTGSSAVSLPLAGTGAAWAQSEEGEAGHMHGPDGRHIAVASAFGGSAGAAPVPLRAFPGPNREESATQTKGPYLFTLSIENEEMAPPDPDVITLETGAARTIGLTTVAAKRVASSAAGGLAATGQVRPNPNRAVTVNAGVGGRLLRVGVTPGDDIPAGHVIAVLDSAEVAEAQALLLRAGAEVQEASSARGRTRAQVAEARAGLERAQAEADLARSRLASARRSLARQRKLAQAGAFAQAPVEEARREVAAAEGELGQAQTALTTLDAQAQRLRSGLESGVVARREVEAAESAAEQGRTRVQTAERQLTIVRAALSREERIAGQGLLSAREVQQAEGEEEAVQAAVRAAEAVVLSHRRTVQATQSTQAEAEATLSRARSAVTSARRRLQLLGATPGGGSQVSVTAPIGGEVEARPVTRGQVVAAGETLARIVNTESVFVESDVFERDLSRVRVGQRASITADAVPGRTFTGRISYIGGQVNPQTRAVRVRTVVGNPGERLKPNMFVRVAIAATAGAGAGGSASPTTGSGSVVIPTEAVQEEGGEQMVFVEEAPGSYRRKTVRVGPSMGGDLVLIERGVGPGDKVVTKGAYQLLSRVKQ